MKALQQEMIHIVAGGWEISVKFSQRKKKTIWNFDVFDCFKGDVYFWGEFRNELRKNMEKASSTKNNILWIWENTKKMYQREI